MKYQSFDPYHLKLLQEFTTEDTSQASAKINALKKTQQAWKNFPVPEKKRILTALGDQLLKHKLHYAALISKEMGKLFTESIAEIEKCAACSHYYAEHLEEFTSEEHLPHGAYIHFEPLGIVYGIFPWNFPFWQVFRSMIPCLLSGNVMLIKHAPNVPQSALGIVETVNAAAGLQLVENIFADAETSEYIISHPDISAVTFTGSTTTGSLIAQQAARHLKKSVLELGGSDPFIVTKNSDLEQAVETAIRSRFQNNGQSCVAAKRFIIHQDLYESFRDQFCNTVAALPLGDPMDVLNRLSCMARPDLKQRLEKQLNESIAMGCKLLTGGESISDTMIQATVLENINPDSPAYKEELFGPVASLFSFGTPEEAVHLANDTSFGLGATVFSNDEEERKFFMKNLQSGMLYFNQLLKSSYEWPFGGIKQSGWGRELTRHGVMEFVNKKLIAGN